MVARNARDGFRYHDGLRFDKSTGAFSFLNPTRAHFIHSSPATASSSSNALTPQSSNAEPAKHEALNEGEAEQAPSSPDRKKHGHKDGEQRADQVTFLWRSRDNRKGRHALVFHPSNSPSAPYVVPPCTNSLQAIGRGVFAMATQFPYWDVSWLVAVIFTLGSVVWVINAFFVWLPLVQPSSEFPGEIVTAGGWSAFVGATIFEIGSVLLMIEAVNANRTVCFGWVLEHTVKDIELGKMLVKAKRDGCRHHHANRSNFVGSGPKQAPTTDKNETSAPRSSLDNDANSSDRSTWQWYPSWHDLVKHYIYELGFLACSFQLFGATVFWISGFTAIPQIAAMLPTQAALNEGYWVPQIVGGCGFIISSTCFMLETQPAWYIPAPKMLGWHIGLWNLIGAFGFTLCGALGPAYGNSGAQFEASLATFWGSWAFLIGSAVQWYESLDKHPVEETAGYVRTNESTGAS